jgi:CHAD domain-containing protein/CYTH domain-containing protein
MHLSPDLLRRSSQEGARRLALTYLNTAAALRGRLADPNDPEALHDFRVAIRRLRSCLRAYSREIRKTVRKRTLRQLEQVADATRESRDLEAHLAWLGQQRERMAPEARPGLDWLTGRLERRRRRAWDEMMKQIDGSFAPMAKALEDELGTFRITVHLDDSEPRKSMARVTAERLNDAADRLKRRLSQIHQYTDDEAIHRARIGAKRVRYLLEPFAQIHEKGPGGIEQLKELQDAFGDVHDVHVFAPTLAEELAHATRTDLRSEETERAALIPGLAAIEASLRERGTAAYEKAEKAWLLDASAGFFETLGKIAETIRTQQGRDQEIERKFLLDHLPAFDHPASVAEIEQGYLPGERIVERIRRVRKDRKDELFRTVKEGTGITRLELEEPLPADLFAQLWPLTDGRRVRKRRYSIEDGNVTWEIDEFLDRELVLAEVELPSPSTEVSPPEWLRPHVLREVTDDSAYTNYRLAIDSPKEEESAADQPGEQADRSGHSLQRRSGDSRRTGKRDPSLRSG